MIYLIVRDYGLSGGQFFVAPVGSKVPDTYKTVEQLAQSLNAQQVIQDRWKAANPKDHAMAKLKVVSADQAPENIQTAFEGRPQTRNLNLSEMQRLLQLVPGLKL